MTRCPNWQSPASSGNDPDLQHGKGVGMNRRTYSWNAAAAVFALGFATLAHYDYLAVGQDQLIGGTFSSRHNPISILEISEFQFRSDLVKLQRGRNRTPAKDSSVVWERCLTFIIPCRPEQALGLTTNQQYLAWTGRPGNRTCAIFGAWSTTWR